jgi:hypothetical protein
MSPEFQTVFDTLKQILTKYEQRTTVIADKPDYYALEAKQLVFRGKPMFFAAVRAGKAYVSFHLMPLYMNPKLNATISPALKKRMQGKSCFNFKAVDRDLVKELKTLTAAGLESFKAIAAKAETN